MESNRRFYIKTSVTLMLIASCVALLLAVVNAVTAARIKENEDIKTESSVRELFPDAASYKVADDIEISTPLTEVREVRDSSGALCGYCVFGAIQGFKSEITFIVGIGIDGKTTGVKVVTNSETAGLGSKISEESYLEGYNGKSGQLTLKKDIDAVAGATISSRALLKGVNAALALPLFNENGDESETSEATEDSAAENTVETTGTETVSTGEAGNN